MMVTATAGSSTENTVVQLVWLWPLLVVILLLHNRKHEVEVVNPELAVNEFAAPQQNQAAFDGSDNVSSPSATSSRRNERTPEISMVENDDGELSEANGAATTASAEIRAVVPTHIYHRRDTRRHFLSLTRKATVQQARELAFEEEEHTTRAVVAAETAENTPKRGRLVPKSTQQSGSATDPLSPRAPSIRWFVITM